MQQKGFAPIIIIIVLVILGLLGYWTYISYSISSSPASPKPSTQAGTPKPTPTPIPMTDWKTYTNDAYGFSFKYPANDWDYFLTNFKGSLNTYRFASKSNKLITLDITVDSSWNGKGGIEKTKPNFLLSGLPAYRISKPAAQNPPSEIVYFENRGKVFTLDLNYGDQVVLVQEFDQILSTFQFTNATSSVSPTPAKNPTACVKAGGTWLDQYNECENFTSDQFCSENGGQLSGCESPCRHSPPGGMCTQVCVPVCKF